MSDYASIIAQHSGKQMPEKKQQKAGQPVKGKIETEHKDFLKTLFALLDSGEINPEEPKSFLKQEIYENLDDEWKDKVDLSLANIANQIRLIAEAHKQAGSENAVQLQTMVEQLWQMKQQIEEQHDAFKF